MILQITNMSETIEKFECHAQINKEENSSREVKTKLRKFQIKSNALISTEREQRGWQIFLALGDTWKSIFFFLYISWNEKNQNKNLDYKYSIFIFTNHNW